MGGLLFIVASKKGKKGMLTDLNLFYVFQNQLATEYIYVVYVAYMYFFFSPTNSENSP